MTHREPAQINSSDYRPSSDEAVNHDDDGDDEQNVNKPASDGKHEGSQSPQDQQNQRNRPEHFKNPL